MDTTCGDDDGAGEMLLLLLLVFLLEDEEEEVMEGCVGDDDGGRGSGPHHCRAWHDQAQKSKYGLQGRTAAAPFSLILGTDESWAYKG